MADGQSPLIRGEVYRNLKRQSLMKKEMSPLIRGECIETDVLRHVYFLEKSQSKKIPIITIERT